MPKTKSNLPPSPAPTTPPFPKHNAKCSAWFMAQYRPTNHAPHIYFHRHCRTTSPQRRTKHPTHTPQDAPAPILISSFFAPHLQFNCKHIPKLHVACSSTANMSQNCILLAELPQICYKIACCLRNFRKYNTKLHVACSSPANMLQNCMMLAELPQICYEIACCLRFARKYITKLLVTCGTPANITQNCMLLTELPQATYKNAHHLRKFRK